MQLRERVSLKEYTSASRATSSAWVWARRWTCVERTWTPSPNSRLDRRSSTSSPVSRLCSPARDTRSATRRVTCTGRRSLLDSSRDPFSTTVESLRTRTVHTFSLCIFLIFLSNFTFLILKNAILIFLKNMRIRVFLKFWLKFGEMFSINILTS